jgi:hypothetical protein
MMFGSNMDQFGERSAAYGNLGRFLIVGSGETGADCHPRIRTSECPVSADTVLVFDS